MPGLADVACSWGSGRGLTWEERTRPRSSSGSSAPAGLSRSVQPAQDKPWPLYRVPKAGFIMNLAYDGYCSQCVSCVTRLACQTYVTHMEYIQPMEAALRLRRTSMKRSPVTASRIVCTQSSLSRHLSTQSSLAQCSACLTDICQVLQACLPCGLLEQLLPYL